MSGDSSNGRSARSPKLYIPYSPHSAGPKQFDQSHQSHRMSGPITPYGAAAVSMATDSAETYNKLSAVSPYGAGDGVEMNIASPVVQTSARHDRRSSRQSATRMSNPDNRSVQLDGLMQENAELRRQCEAARLDQHETQKACDDMLTELMNTQESLSDSQAAVVAKDEELVTLRKEIQRLSDEIQNNHPPSLRPGQGRNMSDDREVKDLRLRCSRLTKEAERRDEQLRQAHEQVGMLQAQSKASPSHNDRNAEVQELHARCADATREAQKQQDQAESYRKTILEWKAAYDSLLDSYNEARRAQTELSQQVQAHKAGPSVDQQLIKRMEASHTTELNEAINVANFYKDNSEKVASKNKTITTENLTLQKLLDETRREVEQQMSFISALQLQIR